MNEINVPNGDPGQFIRLLCFTAGKEHRMRVTIRVLVGDPG